MAKKPQPRDFVFSDKTRTVYWLRDDLVDSRDLYVHYSRNDLRRVLKQLPLRVETLNLNDIVDSYPDDNDPLVNFMEAVPEKCELEIRPPVGRILFTLKIIRTPEEKYGESIQCPGGETFLQPLEKGDGCHFCPPYRNFLKKIQDGGHTLDCGMSIKVFQYNPRDAKKIWEFIESINCELDEEYWNSQRAAVELDRARHLKEAKSRS